MPRDYAFKTRNTDPAYRTSPVRSQRRSHSSHKKSVWLALLLLMIILPLFIFSLSFIQHHSFISSKKEASVPQQVSNIKTTPPENTQDPPSVHFDFYTILPQTTVKTFSGLYYFSESPLPPQKKYIVHIASLPHLTEAEQLQHQLKKQGFDTRILKSPKYSNTWYRVQIGPFIDSSSAQKVYHALQQKEIHSLIVPI